MSCDFGEMTTSVESDSLAYRVLILAPTGRDASLARKILDEAGLTSEIFGTLEDLCRGAEQGAGVIVLSAEAVDDVSLWCLRQYQAGEPSWSEVPIVLLGTEEINTTSLLEQLGNVTLLDRPLRIAEFVAVTRAGMHSRKRQYQVRDLLEQIEQTQRQQRSFLSDVLTAVTHGKLRLCDPDQIKTDGSLLWSHPLSHIEDVPRLRDRLRTTRLPAELDDERWHNFLVAAGEASTNAIKHGQGGQALFYASEDHISLRIEDTGPGISLENLPKATLQGGFSSARTLGMGFTAIVEFVDSIQLATDMRGTIVTLELHRNPRPYDDLLEQLIKDYNDEDYT
jgi:anti-sigma regulatory factor (Ser/Thr protein kinase)